jgi:hypothetical protein
MMDTGPPPSPQLLRAVCCLRLPIWPSSSIEAAVALHVHVLKACVLYADTLTWLPVRDSDAWDRVSDDPGLVQRLETFDRCARPLAELQKRVEHLVQPEPLHLAADFGAVFAGEPDRPA